MRETSLGVVIVAYNSGPDIVDCVESLAAAAAATERGIRIVVVDNASSDDSVARLRAWAAGQAPYAVPGDLPFALAPVAKPLALREGDGDLAPDPDAAVTLIHSGANRGFAGGVNVGLAHLARDPAIGHFWILNPDCVVPPEAIEALAARLETAAPYALMGGRVTYRAQPDRIQTDGGTLNRRTGVTGNLNLGRSHAATPPPDPGAVDFVMGGSMIASRAFYETAGPMCEAYFLYYEEVDWALRRGALPLDWCPGLRIYHRAGGVIGSPAPGRPASPFSLYFKHRARILFLRRFLPARLAWGRLYSLAYAGRLVLRNGALAEADAVLRGAFGRPPPGPVRDRLGPETGFGAAADGAG